MSTIEKRQTKTVTIYIEDFNVLNTISNTVTPPATKAEVVAMLVRMYEEAPEVEDNEPVERFVQTTPIVKREPMEELLEPEVTEPVAPVVENKPAEIKPHTEPDQKVYTDLLSRFLHKEGQPIVSKHKVVVIKHGDGL